MKRFAVLVLTALTAPTAAMAHPHVMVDVHALVEFKDGKAVSLFMGWTFDPVFSSSLLADFDADKNGRLDPGEVKALEAEAFRDTREQSHFTYARIGDTPVKWPDVTNFKVMAVKDSLLYAFRLNFPQPVDPRKAALSFTTYEETFYIDMDFPNDKAVSLTGEGSQGCKAVIAPDPASAIYGGAVIPKRATITCD
ncbi:DUF1007 family protein [Magnetospirillum sp. SS-4]|uniref:DUF1007 family protein n=1 Tax=Magnetospirillum sp. SS-4 TaxID=2681465 RepID=UPI001381900D|nr:DUF1007 family protein [Magnetospirillum sp. SS-4]CAA7617573.1 ABC-type uncharacterized transport system [Magnetospirillum sp. SS-4]